MPYAEVIGDPIAHSKSPLIHKAWLAELGLDGDYRATRVQPDELSDYFRTRRQDPDWRGCNVTIPHKEKVIAFLDEVDPAAAAIGAVNCIARGPRGLAGRNTDMDGLAAALDCIDLEDAKAVVIGAGGGARAAIRYLTDRKTGTISLLVRNPAKAASFAQQGPDTSIDVLPIERCDDAMAGARLVINASPMGMDSAAEMPAGLLACVAGHARGCTMFDMVYKPLETQFLATAEAHGGAAIGGLTMLIGQARAAFEAFFGHPSPAGDANVRALLVA